jgi:hypothetical protein
MTNPKTTTRANPRKRMCAHVSACVLRLMEKSTADQRVETREAEMWKSCVNAITWLVHSWTDRLEQVVLICKVYKAC